MRRRSFVGLTLGFAVVFGLVSSTNPPLPPGFIAAFHWQSADPLFGGFSAIDVAPDGSNFITINDRSAYVLADVTRDDIGRIIRINAKPQKRLRDKAGRLYSPYRGDTEGLAIADDGTIFVSFEQYARVTKFLTLVSRGSLLPMPEMFKALPNNAALEALAIDADGTLFAVAERPIGRATSFPVYRYKFGMWDQPFTLPRSGKFLAVAADIGPDGRFYLLERQFHGFSGFASRVRRFALGPNDPISEEILFQTNPGQHDNLEGLSVWRDKSGSLRLTMISDNNFLFLQRTEIVEYRVPD